VSGKHKSADRRIVDYNTKAWRNEQQVLPPIASFINSYSRSQVPSS